MSYAAAMTPSATSEVFVRVRSLSRTLGGVVDLALLRAVNSTCDSLAALQRAFEPIADQAFAAARELEKVSPATGEYIDPDDDVVNGLSVAIRALENFLPGLIRKKTSIDEDARLGQAERDMLHASYDHAAEAISYAIEGARALVDAAIKHDLAAEPRGERVFESADALIEHLRSGN